MSRLNSIAILLACALAACRAPASRDEGSPDAGPLAALSQSATTAAELISSAPPISPTACEAGLTARGEASVCASCACGRCESDASACAGDAPCASALACMHKNGCDGLGCYCGASLEASICLVSPKGPCRAEMEAAAGKGLFAVQNALSAGTKSKLGRAAAVQACTRKQGRCEVQCAPASEACTFEDEACQTRVCKADPALAQQRHDSALIFDTPVIERLRVNGSLAWQRGDTNAPTLRAGDRVTLEGHGFGRGPDVDYAKITIGQARVLERDLTMYDQELNILTQVHHETTKVHGQWPKDIRAWDDTHIELTVPGHVSRGPIVVQVQKRLLDNGSLVRPGDAHAVVDAITMRVTDPKLVQRCDVVSDLSTPVASEPLDVNIENPSLDALVAHGRAVFWSYDYNIGTAHAVRGLDWKAIFAGKTTDPITGKPADPELLFGAYPAVRGESPDEALDPVYFDPYPQPSPIPGFLTLAPQAMKGNTRSSGFVGYRYAESVHPYVGPGEWIGFNCASCHSYRISYERAPGQQITRVIPGLPNPRWTMKWTLLGSFKGIKENEEGPLWAPGKADVDKTHLLYALPPGAGEHTLVRIHGEGSATDNDYQFSPIAIPNVTYYLPIRRSLSHTESYAGFEGSYIHSEEPDGALGSMHAEDLKALTAYMGTLDAYDDDLREVGLYRWLRYKGWLGTLAPANGEGDFVSRGHDDFPALVERLEHGKSLFAAQCASCHEDAVGTHSNERMIRLDQVGRFFAPTIYQREMQAIRVAFLRDLYWVQQRGLLSDGHVRNLEELVHPDRCTESSALYKRYYTLHKPAALPAPGPDAPAPVPGSSPRGDVFRVLEGDPKTDAGKRRNLFVERHRYFVEQPADPGYYAWDYQKMRREYGPWELGTARPIGMPATPHPWCAEHPEDVDDLVLYLLTL